MQISIKADVDQTLRDLSGERVNVLKAAVRSLNRTADQVRTAGVRSIAQEMGLKQKVVRDGLRVVRANRRTLTSIVVATGQAIGLINFRAHKMGAGVLVTIRGERTLFKGAFIATMPGGHRGVFRRRNFSDGFIKKRIFGNRKANLHSVKIRELWGPSIPDTMAQTNIYKALERVVDVRWPINFAADLKYYLNR